MSLFIDEVVEENARLKEEIEKLKQENQHYLEEYEILGEEWSKLLDDKISYSHLLQKYKKIIKIIKEKCLIILDYHDPKTIETLDDYKYISDEEYDLLKEVFGDE